MTAEERRSAILSAVSQSQQPVSATALARRFGVSRQSVVGDVALLRAAGADITATPRGYTAARTVGPLRRLACRHTAAEMEAELNCMVDNGCAVLDVVVEHPVYGQLTGQLDLRSRYDVQQFVARSAQSEARPLSLLTEGIHLHTVSCPDEAAFRRVQEGLRELGVLLEE